MTNFGTKCYFSHDCKILDNFLVMQFGDWGVKMAEASEASEITLQRTCEFKKVHLI